MLLRLAIAVHDRHAQFRRSERVNLTESVMPGDVWPRGLPHKQHGQKEQPVAHEYRREQPILDRAALLAHDTD